MAAQEVHAGTSFWQAMLHTALADAPGVPSPFWLEKVAVFLVPASLLLALVSVGQPRQVPAVIAIMPLALVARGAFDAPLRALCAVTAAVWAALACVDERRHVAHPHRGPQEAAPGRGRAELGHLVSSPA